MTEKPYIDPPIMPKTPYFDPPFLTKMAFRPPKANRHRREEACGYVKTDRTSVPQNPYIDPAKPYINPSWPYIGAMTVL